MQFSRLPVRSVGEHPLNPLDRAVWPATLSPVRHLLDSGLELGAATILVGENGSGKSTLVEAIALAYGLGSEGGSIPDRDPSPSSTSDRTVSHSSSSSPIVLKDRASGCSTSLSRHCHSPDASRC